MTALDRLRSELADAQQALADFDEAHQPGPTDPGTLSMNRHLTQGQMNKKVQGFVNHMGRVHGQSVVLVRRVKEAERTVQLEEQRLRDEAAASTLDQLPAAKAVRDRYGWHAVKHVNRKSVTVWDRDWAGKPVGRTIPIDKIKEVKS